MVPASVPLSQEPAPAFTLLFKAALARLMFELRRGILPHLAGGVGLFLLVSYVTALTLFSSWNPVWKWLGVWGLFVLYGAVAFGYCLFTACVFALRAACVAWNDFIDGILDLVQTNAAQHVANLEVGLSKPQAKSILRGSVREVFASFRQSRQRWPRLVLWVGLGALALAVRAVLSAQVIKWSGRTVQLTKLFAGRATLVGAIFLNLYFFSTVLLVACYAFGAAVVAVNIYFVFLLK